ncbi:serine transporter [Salmonella enterica subsp. arizonae]|uniref:Serine transporter n=1 Tax=Salmonella enterica subsp. arizonae TaxID=59203 RepID=A0A2X4T187_SALER|nr:serine transporter [Salmonella enterica subsp. arizonae]
MLQNSGIRSHHDGADRNVLRLQLRTEPDAGRSGGGKRAEHLYSVLPGEHFNAPIIAWMAPIIAMIAITKSFLATTWARVKALNGMVIKSLRGKGKSIEINKLNKITALFMLVTTWIVATLNPSILGMIETMGGPIIAMILFLMPMYAHPESTAMRKYSGHISNIFVVVIGLIAISAIFYSLFS